MADTLTNERLQLAADRLGGLEEIDRSTYPEFFDDAGILANAARQLLSRPTAPAEPVAWRKPEHPAATEPLFIDANLRTEQWMMGVFIVPLYAAPPASPPVSDKMVHAAIAAQQSAKAAYDGPFEAMRAALLAALGGHHD